MTKFFVRTATWALSIISVVFTFVPESFFCAYKILPKATKEVNIIANRFLSFLLAVVLVAIVYACIRRFRRSVHIKGRNYHITVSYGDIFNITSCKKVIPFDECFSSEVGQKPAQVKPSSICGQYLLRCPIANIQSLINQAQLKPCKNKSQYKGLERFESGRLVPNGDYLLMAFTKLDKDGLGRLTRGEFLDCLDVLWREIDKHYGQSDVCIPILGSGITRIDDCRLTQQELLDMIIGSYKLSAHKIKEPAKLHIVCKRHEGFSLSKIGEHL